MSTKLMPGSALPSIELPLLTGGTYRVGQKKGAWELFLIYRGKHCPRCKTYLNKLQGLVAAFSELNVSVIVASADTLDKAQADLEEYQWSFPLAYQLTEANIKSLGLWASSHSDGSVYAEPGLFVINPEGEIQIIGLGNTASCRPDLEVLLDGIKGIQTRGLPIMGSIKL